MSNNWKETLFVWDGILKEKDGDDDDHDGGINLKWEGTWVGCDFADATKVETPKRGAFDENVSSDNKFEVTGAVIPGTKDEDAKEETKDDEKKPSAGSNIGGDAKSLYRVSMTGGLGWDMGENDEKKKHKDTAHDVYFSILRWTGNLRDQVQNIVFAIGENEFGNFISVGWLRVGNRVSLARRYLNESDERSKWDIEDLRKAVFGEIAAIVEEEDGRVEVRIPPWQCAAMNADAGLTSKRQKTATE